MARMMVEENVVDIELPSKKETREQVQQQLRYVKKSLKEVCEAVPNIKDWEECSELDISYLTVIINGIAKDLEKAYEVTSDYHRLNNPICNDEDEYEDEEPGDWYEGDESFSSMFGEDNYD